MSETPILVTKECDICVDEPPYVNCDGLRAPESAGCCYIENLELDLAALRACLYQERQDHAHAIRALKLSASEEIQAANKRAKAAESALAQERERVLQEPTDNMCVAGKLAIDTGLVDYGVADVYKAMIRALAHGGEGK